MILMIDNYDSFTYNLVQMLVTVGAEVEVVRNDALTVDDAVAREPAGIVLSPGPGRPEDAGICIELYQRRVEVPIFGVCLGHQALGEAFGGEVVRAERIMHGKTSWVEHTSDGVFENLPQPFEATRYHSLVVAPPSLPAELEALAWADDGATIMGMRHRELPYHGVQFHPESVLTACGPSLLANFLGVCGLSVGEVKARPAPGVRPPGSFEEVKN